MLAHLASPTAIRSHEELFAYWASLRVGGRLPGRAQIDPDQFKRHLPTVSLTEVGGEPRSYRLRLAGTELYSVYGREITGKSLEDVYSVEAAAYWRGELDRIVESGRPAAGCHSLSWRGTSHLSMLWLRLPLAADGRQVDMILGYDQVVGAGPDSSQSGVRAA